MDLKLDAGAVVFLDTAPFIYLIEGHGDFCAPVRELIAECIRVRAQMVTSLITYIEVLTQPERMGRTDLAARYRMFLTNSEYLSIHPFNLQVADECVRIRAKNGFKTPDAIQLAVARACGASLLVTNDADWKRCKELNVVLVSELV
ncbi:MAG: PIN domain-containing protein [Verrucomicrobiota bacterium]|jgi:predicted nucleic acid-binding protein|nr:PIN domain-containing protein [Verrucomicrobiota bacterium]